jgi:hypothetical protein
VVLIKKKEGAERKDQRVWKVRMERRRNDATNEVTAEDIKSDGTNTQLAIAGAAAGEMLLSSGSQSAIDINVIWSGRGGGRKQMFLLCNTPMTKIPE